MGQEEGCREVPIDSNGEMTKSLENTALAEGLKLTPGRLRMRMARPSSSLLMAAGFTKDLKLN